MKLCLRCIVRGRVQGVFYRATTEQQAVRHGLSGHALNLPDGSVEVLLCGEEDKVRQVSDWLWQGSTYARVTAVECETVEMEAPAGFSTG